MRIVTQFFRAKRMFLCKVFYHNMFCRNSETTLRYRRLTSVNIFIFLHMEVSFTLIVARHMSWMQLKMFLATTEVCDWFRWNREAKFHNPLIFMLRVTSRNGAFSVRSKNIKITNCFSSQKFLHAQDLYLLRGFSGKFQRIWTFRFKDILKLVVTVWFVPLDCATDQWNQRINSEV